MEVLTPRDVPLGGLRAMTVRRTLPQRQRTLIGAWCFVDHYGPDELPVDPTFEHHAPEPVGGEGWEARVFIGSLLGSVSPVTTHSPLLGAELVLEAGTTVRVPVDPSYELGLLVDTGEVRIDGSPLGQHELGFLEPGRDEVVVSTTTGARLLVLGGPPFGERIVMWWNFIARDHDEVVAYRAQWEALLEKEGVDRFRLPVDDPRAALHAPALPNARMVPRGP